MSPPASPLARDPSYDLAEVRRVQPRVDAAADKLLGRGVAPTVSLVRAEIGGGSPNVVAPALRYWRERRDRALGRDRADDAVPSPVLVAARALYDAALDVAARAAGTSQVELAAQLESERARNAALAAELKHLRREVETLRAERASVFEAAGHTHAELVNAQTLAAHCVAEQRAVQAKLDASQTGLGEARARITALEAMLAAAKTSGRDRAPKKKNKNAAKTLPRVRSVTRAKKPGRAAGVGKRARRPAKRTTR